MKNKMTDLNDHLFQMLEKLNDEDLTGDALKAECDRATAIARVGKVIVDNAANAIKAQALIHSHKDDDVKLPDFLLPSKNEDHPVFVPREAR